MPKNFKKLTNGTITVTDSSTGKLITSYTNESGIARARYASSQDLIQFMGSNGYVLDHSQDISPGEVGTINDLAKPGTTDEIVVALTELFGSVPVTTTGGGSTETGLAKDNTLTAISNKVATDAKLVEISGKLKVSAGNKLDVELPDVSALATNATLTALSAKLPAALAAGKLDVALPDVSLLATDAKSDLIVTTLQALIDLITAQPIDNGTPSDVVNALQDSVDVNILNFPPGTGDPATATNQLALTALLQKGAQTTANSIGVNLASDQTITVKATNTPSISSGGYNANHHKIWTMATSAPSQLLRGSAAVINWAYVHSTVACYFKIYNGTATPGVGTDNPTYTFFIPANTGVFLNIKDTRFATGLGYTATGAAADLDGTTLTGTLTVDVNYF